MTFKSNATILLFLNQTIDFIKGKLKLFDILGYGQFYCFISVAPTFSPVSPLRASERVNVRTTLNTAWLLLDSLFMLVAATVLDWVYNFLEVMIQSISSDWRAESHGCYLE